MSESTDLKIIEDSPKAVSRRRFIKGVIAGGAAVSSANYLFRSSTVHGQTALVSGERLITLSVNGRQRRVDAIRQHLSPTLFSTSVVSPFVFKPLLSGYKLNRIS